MIMTNIKYVYKVINILILIAFKKSQKIDETLKYFAQLIKIFYNMIWHIMRKVLLD